MHPVNSASIQLLISVCGCVSTKHPGQGNGHYVWDNLFLPYQVVKPITLKQLNGPITVMAKAKMLKLNGFSYSFKQLYSRTLLLVTLKRAFCKQTKYDYEDSLH